MNWFSKSGREESGEVGSGGGLGQGDAKELGSPVLTQSEFDKNGYEAAVKQNGLAHFVYDGNGKVVGAAIDYPVASGTAETCL